MQAISAVDIALWDLMARLLNIPLTRLLGRIRDTVPVYGSGGFTTLTDPHLDQQISQWADTGCTAMKIKIGEHWGTDITRTFAGSGNCGTAPHPVCWWWLTPTGRPDGSAPHSTTSASAGSKNRLSSEDLTGLAALRAAMSPPANT